MAKANISVPKTQYDRIARQAKAYRAFVARFFESVIRDPVEDVVGDFRESGLYAEEFLRDMEDGLRRSSYAKRHGTSPAPKRS